MSKMDYKKHLEELRSKLANKHLSVMIGSGFSKNVSLKFPTWNELLQDLVYEQYKTEINLKFFEAARSSKLKRLDKIQFVKLCCYDIIKKRGYLNVVSDFLQNNRPETLAIYIEERTPYIKVRPDKTLLLQLDRVEEELSDEKLGLHRDIVSLPWNNIYTTNYDQLLELCIDEGEYDRLLNEIKILEQEIDQINARIEEIVNENEMLDQQELTDMASRDNNTNNGVDPEPEMDTEQRDDRAAKRTLLRDERFAISATKELNRSLIKLKENSLPNCYNVVIEATALKLKRNNNIIKLHGSLRTPEQRDNHVFGFDNDNKKQYVISKEDYDSYPQKHEAFTQLMRISLLQESFCLIGFSGDDPNFHAWIGWVRDILQRVKASDPEGKSYKIYLIDVNTNTTPLEKLLFFENYNIIRIPITDESVVQILKNGVHPVQKECNDNRSTLELFLDYLGNHDEIKPVVSTGDLSAETEWRDVWKNVRLPERYWTREASADAKASRLDRIRNQISIPNFRETYGQRNLLNTFFYDNRRHPDKRISEAVSKLLVYALRDYYVPITQVLETSAIEKLKSEPVVSEEVTHLLYRDLSLSLKQDPNDGSCFHKVLILAYSFRFDELQRYLDTWIPEVLEVNKKAGFLSLFDASKAEEFLEQQLKLHNKFTAEQRLYLIEHLTFISNSLRFPVNKKLKRTLRAYERAGFRPLYENFDYLMEELEKNPERPEPRGAGRYSVSSGDSDARNQYQPYALKYLMLLVESGFQFKLRNTVWLNEKKWYKVIRWGLELYPHAFLFYGLQFSDANYLKRLGEEYAFSNVLEVSVLNEIALNLLKSIPSAPYSYAKNIELFLSRMLKGVSPDIWEEPFMELWRESVTNDSAFDEAHINPMTELNYFAFQYLEQQEHILEVLKAVYTNSALNSGENELSYSYYLSKNVHYEFLNDIGILSKWIDPIIDQLSFHKLEQLFLLNNTRKLLTEDQKMRIAERIKDFNFEQVSDARAWYILHFYVKEDITAVQAIKDAILKSGKLWDTGRISKTRWSSSHPIELSHFTAGMGDVDGKGIIWSDNEVLSIFQRMGTALVDLKDLYDKNDRPFYYGDLILEMKWFLRRFARELENVPGYGESQAALDLIYRKTVNYNTLEDGLLSSQRSDVVWALSELGDRYRKGIYDFGLLQIVVNKCMLQSDPALEASLSYVASWLARNNELITYQGIMESVFSILRKYQLRPLEGYDTAFVEERLIIIAYEMQRFDQDNESVKWWLCKAKDSRFNNVRQLVLRKHMEFESF